MKTKNRSSNTERWIARILGLLFAAFAIFMFIGYIIEGRQRHPGEPFLSGVSPIVMIIFIVWGIGLFGLLLGWWNEKLGGFLSVSCFILVFILNLFNQEAQGKMIALIPMVILSIPSFLFISCWYDAKKKVPR
ncbi:MAG: DUF7670 domain-containing protein [Bacteroidales bacterium]